MCCFSKLFPCNFRKKIKVPPTLRDQTTDSATHLSLQTRQLPATQAHSFLLAFPYLFSIMEMLKLSPVCLPSALEHYPLWHFLSTSRSNIEVPLPVSAPFPLASPHASSASCPGTRAVMNYPAVIGKPCWDLYLRLEAWGILKSSHCSVRGPYPDKQTCRAIARMLVHKHFLMHLSYNRVSKQQYAKGTLV